MYIYVAYVHGTRVGIAPEQPFRMGDTLPGAKIPILDINAEKDIIEERLRFLQTQKLSDKEITRSMKDLGIERLIQNPHNFTCFQFSLSIYMLKYMILIEMKLAVIYFYV